MNIVVVGSLNMDVVNRVGKHPLPGETIKGKGTDYIPGGKGANQAVAAARANASVRMVGAVGTDGFGKQLLTSLNRDGIDTTNVFVKDGTSGLAFITVNDQGENNIILSEGANGALSTADIQSISDTLCADAVLVQNEIPLETTYETIRSAYGKAARIYYNPAPAHPISKEILQMVDVLVLNETEASVVLNKVFTTHKEYVDAAKELVLLGAKSVILTLGPEGSIFVNENQSVRVPAFQVSAVDTTAAGDTFIGAFASIYAGENAMESLKFASAASAITVTRSGAQISIPTRQEIEEFLKHSL
ncbi:ribokinase [Alicyclobacillus fastidiosus]|uniref:Ribokinase n=1 Tax=Alicyclobacillus fastidiosus TaxID=392011 RepID=A0ABY6ZBY1_9BACL|nr:ribokinase [Alicyclobacillus fastidiosus]WAH40240.1 ribokinase [Alicyclobacillus fastidiosus]GMA61605.1 ribokinase [Alicyclobacillus fastidiosus]